MSHTKEPWEATPQRGEPGSCFVAQIFDSDGEFVAQMKTTKDEKVASLKAARIVACVNACAGMSNPAMVTDLLAIVQALREVDVARSSSVLAGELTELHKRAVALLGEPEWKTEGGA